MKTVMCEHGLSLQLFVSSDLESHASPGFEECERRYPLGAHEKSKPLSQDTATGAPTPTENEARLAGGI